MSPALRRHVLVLAFGTALVLAGCGDDGGGGPAFSDIGAGLTGVAGSLAWGDYDNDGDLDLALAGATTSTSPYDPISKVFRNDGGTFTAIGAGLTGVHYCSLAWGDYDNDGDLDLALAGDDSSGRISKVYRNDGGTFTDTAAALTGVSYCSLAWGDYDNDGDLDLALAGLIGIDNYISKVYRNDAGTFTDISAGLTGVSDCSLAWGDYDNDGDLDLALAGYDIGYSPVSKVYRNDAGTFSDLDAGLTGVGYCSLAWGDYDNDGDLDLALAGSESGTGHVSKVYRNDGGTFTDIGAGLTGVHWCSLAWGDYDNDGDLDLALAGSGISKVYRNDGGTFTDIGAGLTGVGYPGCSLVWGDYDNDGDLDLALAGRDTSLNPISNVYRNNGGVFNTSPAGPAGLSASASGNALTFSWDASVDGETPEGGLAYNLRVGTASGTDDVFSGTADPSSGLGLLPATGNAQKRLSWTIRGLQGGTYYWSVQAVDTAFARSAWAAEQTSSVTGPAIEVKQPDGSESWALDTTHTIRWTWAGSIANVRIELFRDGSWSDLAPSAANTGSYSWSVSGSCATGCLVRVSDVGGSGASDVSGGEFTVVQFHDIGAGLTGVHGSLAWGDYDNDGDLDLLHGGGVHRNDGGTFTDIGAGLPGVGWGCSLAWGDYDNDGDLDLALAGYTGAGTVYATEIRRNDAGTFTDIGAGLARAGVWGSSLAWGDYDNDGDLDMVFSGVESEVYRNDGGTFTDIDAGLTGSGTSSLAWGDYDNDGDLDLLQGGGVYRNNAGTFTGIATGLTGRVSAWGDYDNDGDLDLALAGGSLGSYVSKVYRNDAETFTVDTELTDAKVGTLAWGDYDNDGDLDLVVAGAPGTYSTQLYRNNGGTFTEIPAGLEFLAAASLAWGDYDGDGDLDLAMAGISCNGDVSRIYSNGCGVSNTAPAAPTGLSSSVSGSDVTFSWADATDTETPPEGLSYNLRVGTTSGGGEVFSSMADAATGWRRIPARGVVQPGLSVNEWTLRGVPADTYYWSVQAVDTGLTGGAWATEQSVTVP